MFSIIWKVREKQPDEGIDLIMIVEQDDIEIKRMFLWLPDATEAELQDRALDYIEWLETYEEPPAKKILKSKDIEKKIKNKLNKKIKK